MSRKLLIGTTEYTWPNDGDLEWGQEVYDWAQAISQAVTEGGSTAGIPPGGSVGQVLTKQSSADFEVIWTSAGEYRAGEGLRLSGGTFRIDDEGVTYHLIDDKISENLFGAPRTNRAFGAISFELYDVYPVNLFNSNDIWINAKSANRRYIYGDTAIPVGRQSTFAVARQGQVDDSTSEFGTASNGTHVCRPVVANETITHLRAFGSNGFYRPEGDITLSEAIPGVTGTSTSLTYNFHQSAFYFINNVRDIYKIEDDGTVSTFLAGTELTDIPTFTNMQSIGTYLCFVNLDYGRGELPVTAVNIDNVEGEPFRRRTFTLGRPADSNSDDYKHYGFTIINGIIYTLTAPTISNFIRLMEHNGLNGIFGSQATTSSGGGEVADDSVGPDKLTTTNEATDGQILSKGTGNNFTWVPASEAGVEDLSGVRGGSGITVTHTNSNEIATVAVVDSIQERLLPTGGTANQFLTRQSDDPNTFDWTTLNAGQGLLLENGTFSIPDYGIEYKLLDLNISQFLFQSPLNSSRENIEIDGLNNVDFFLVSNPKESPQTLSVVPRDTSNTFYRFPANNPSNIQTITFPDSVATSEYGTTFIPTPGRPAYYRPVVSGTNITTLREYGTTGLRYAEANDITLSTAIPNIDEGVTSFVYSDYFKAFYFHANGIIYKIDLNGIVTVLQSSPASGDTMEIMDNYLCFYDKPSDNVIKNYVLYSLVEDGDRLVNPEKVFRLSRPFDITTGYQHVNVIKADKVFYAITAFAEGLSESYRLSRFFAGNGHFDLQLNDLPEVESGETYTARSGLTLSDDNEFSVTDNGLGPDKLNISNPDVKGNRAIPAFSSDSEFQYLQAATLPQFFSDHSITFNKLYEATHYVDNGGSIDPREGDYNMGLVYKRQTGVGTPNEEWVPVNLDEIFTLSSVQIGADDNPNRQHDYGLQFRPGAIQYTDINPVDDFDNLIGLNFIQNPAIISNGNPLRPRLAKPWTREDDNLFPNSQFDTTDVKFTIPRTRTALTRGITHILVKAGRISGITDSSTRDDIITNGVDDPSNVYHEVSLSLSAAYAKNNAAARRDGFDRYNVLFAAGVSCAVEVKANEDGTLDIIAEVNNSSSTLNGQEYIAFYAIRGAGG